MRSRHSDLRETLIRRAAPLATGLLLAACAASPPAPIVSRTGSASTQPIGPGVPPAAPPPAAPAAAPAPVPATAPDAPVVQTAPIRSGSVESRSAASAPPPSGATGAPGSTPPAAAAPTAPAVASAPVLPPNARTGPRGTKVPFTDSALAELRAAESGPAGTGARAADARSAAPPAPAAAAPAAGPATAPAAEPKAADGGWAWPSSGRVLQTFDQSSNKGIALAGKPGDPVLAAADGRVIFSGNGPRGYGNLVIVKHSNDLLSVYAHNRSLAVKEGQSVTRGQKIAELGDSGTTSPRLHFEIRQQGKPVDPAKFLPKR